MDKHRAHQIAAGESLPLLGSPAAKGRAQQAKRNPPQTIANGKKGRDKTTSARTVYHRRAPRVKRDLHKDEESFGLRACRSLSPLPRTSAGKKNPGEQRLPLWNTRKQQRM